MGHQQDQLPVLGLFRQESSQGSQVRQGILGQLKKEFNADNSETGPRPMSSAVSIQRHHWLEKTRAESMPRARNHRPISYGPERAPGR